MCESQLHEGAGNYCATVSWANAAVLVILLSLPVQAQIESRTEQLELLRRDKVTRLRPERQSEFVNLVNKYVERGLFEDPGKGSNGFQPAVLGGMRAGNGFSYGVGYRRSDLWRDHADFRFTARGTPQNAYMFDFRFALSKLQTERGFLDFYAKFENSPQMDYYGTSGPGQRVHGVRPIRRGGRAI